MADAVGKVHIFTCGYEFEIWTERNCASCREQPLCRLLTALCFAALYDGTIDGSTADALGYQEQSPPVLGWPCKAKVPA